MSPGAQAAASNNLGRFKTWKPDGFGACRLEFLSVGDAIVYALPEMPYNPAAVVVGVVRAISAEGGEPRSLPPATLVTVETECDLTGARPAICRMEVLRFPALAEGRPPWVTVCYWGSEVAGPAAPDTPEPAVRNEIACDAAGMQEID